MKTAGKKRISTDRKMKPAEDSNIAATVGKKTVYAFGPGLTSVTPAQVSCSSLDKVCVCVCVLHTHT